MNSTSPYPPHWHYPTGGLDPQGLQGVILGRLLTGQDRQIELLQRAIDLLQRIESKMDQRPPDPPPRTNYTDLLANIRATAYAILPILILVLVVAGKLTLVEGMGVIRHLILGPAAP